jgi:hypothetical protein
MLDSFALWKLAHVALFAIWLGADLASAYVARHVLDAARTAEARSAAYRILLGLEQWPRYCLVLMLPVGYSLARAMGAVRVPDGVFLGMWIISAAWLLLVYAEHRLQGTQQGRVLRVLDHGWRCLLVFGLTWDALQGLRGAGHIDTPFVAVKFALLAAVILFGLGLRILGGPLRATLQTLTDASVTPQFEASLRGTLFRMLPLKISIWLALLGATYVGIAKPSFALLP